MPNYVYEIVGWTGAIAVVVGFALVSFEVILPTDLSYQLINVFGSTGVLINAFHKKDYPSGGLNVVFAIIAILALVRILI